MKITSVRTAAIDGNFPWVLARIETDEDITGHGHIRNRDVARANLKQHSSFFGEYPWEC